MDLNSFAKKLRLDPGRKNLILNAPAAYASAIKDIPHDTGIQKKSAGHYDFVQVFATSQAELEKLCKRVEGAGKYDCVFWACYPKGTGKIKSDIKRDTVWRAFDLIKLQAVSQVAIDDTWSALRARPIDAVGT